MLRLSALWSLELFICLVGADRIETGNAAHTMDLTTSLVSTEGIGAGRGGKLGNELKIKRWDLIRGASDPQN